MHSLFFLSQFQILFETSTIAWQDIFKITTWIVLWILVTSLTLSGQKLIRNNEHDVSTNDRYVVVFSSSAELQSDVSSKSRSLQTNHCSLRNETVRAAKLQATMQNFDYDNHYFAWMLEVEAIKVAARSNQTSWIEQSTSNLQNLRKSELVEKWKQKDFESCFWVASDADKSSVSSCCFLVVLLDERERTLTKKMNWKYIWNWRYRSMSFLNWNADIE